MSNVNRLNKRRGFWIFMLCLAAMCILVGKLVYLQIIKYDEYQRKSVDNILREYEVNAERGTIYDRNMVQLATNISVWRVFISPVDIEDEQQVIFRRFLTLTMKQYSKEHLKKTVRTKL